MTDDIGQPGTFSTPMPFKHCQAVNRFLHDVHRLLDFTIGNQGYDRRPVTHAIVAMVAGNMSRAGLDDSNYHVNPPLAWMLNPGTGRPWSLFLNQETF